MVALAQDPAGVVFQPHWAEGFSMSFDGYGDINRAFDTMGRTYSAGVRVRFE